MLKAASKRQFLPSFLFTTFNAKESIKPLHPQSFSKRYLRLPLTIPYYYGNHPW